MATRSIAERRRAASTPLTFRLPAPLVERQQAFREISAVVLAWLYRAQVTLESWGARVVDAAREARLVERALSARVSGWRWVALWSERARRAWRARRAMLAARREAVVTGRPEPLAAHDPSWRTNTSAARIEFHDAPAPLAVRAMPSTPLPEYLWRQWHEPAADRVPHAPPLRLAVVMAVVACMALLALSVATYAAVTHGWRGLPTFVRHDVSLHPVVIRSGTTATPSVDQPPYYVGAWVSDSTPQPTSVVTVYVRVTNAATQSPVSGAAVTVRARFTCQSGGSAHLFGPATTGADGLAAVQVSFAGLPVGQPVCLTATASVGGQTYSAETTFTAAFPPAPTAAPTSSTSPGDGGGDGHGGGGGGVPTPTPTPPGHGKP